jgi:TolB-like protein
MTVPNRHSLATVFALALTLAACASPPAEELRLAVDEMSEDLVAQLAQRTDPRHVRVLVYDFQPCNAPGSRVTMTAMRTMNSDHEFARQIKHQLISMLAKKVVVIEGDLSDAWLPPDAPDVDTKSDAESVALRNRALQRGATAVLVGNYLAIGDEGVLLMARLVDAKTNQVLATAEQTIEDARAVPRAQQ